MYRFHAALVKFIPKCFVPSNAVVNGIVLLISFSVIHGKYIETQLLFYSASVS
jgi:hypothetical protein